uniref:Uncharacterized protein n=1 Tax=Timema shepardi TaxID=629360 RepID=A0A7R9B089_TIMSH|nr:unnamed protein product [Timema shepardi]
MEDGYTMLTHWTKKIIVEEGHSMQQLFHILQLIVRHYKVYYPVRHHLVQNMVNSIQRMGFSTSATLEHRRLAVELAEVIIKWELQRIKDEAEAAETRSGTPTPSGGVKQTLCSEEMAAIVEGARKRHAVITGTMLAPAVISKQDPLISKPIERIHADAILNILMRLACQVNDANTTAGSPGEQLSRRCVALLKMALKPEVWPQQCDLKLNWLEKVFAGIDSVSPNYGNICTALELLTYLLGIIKKEHILAGFKPLQRGLSACITSSWNSHSVNDANTTAGSPGEQLSRRCVALLKMALKPEVWPQQCDLKLNWLEKVFAGIDSVSPNYGNICTALELLTLPAGDHQEGAHSGWI